MMTIISMGLLVTGAVFFLAGTIGLLRFPDVYTRLHALTKADNVGFGFIVAGLAAQSSSFFLAAQLLLIWGLILFSSAVFAYLVAQDAQKNRIPLWKR